MITFTPKFSLMVSFFILLSVLISQPASAQEAARYTRFNIHTQSKDGKTFKASYANYTDPGEGHVIIPAGTLIQLVDKSRKTFTFTCDSGAKEVIFEFHKPRMGMSLDDYLDKITTLEPVSLDHLSTLDKKGVTDGKAYQGMTREGVMTALGYPASHRTPSLDAASWVYWTNRFGTIAVDFDASGTVSGVRD
jgi:hypothetical protein